MPAKNCQKITLTGHSCSRSISGKYRKYCWQHSTSQKGGGKGGTKICSKTKQGEVSCKVGFKQSKCKKITGPKTKRKVMGCKQMGASSSYECNPMEVEVTTYYDCEADPTAKAFNPLEGKLKVPQKETQCKPTKTGSIIIDTYVALSCLFQKYPSNALVTRWETELQTRYRPRYQEIKKEAKNQKETIKNFFNKISIAEDENQTCYYSLHRWNFILGLFEHGGCNCACGSTFYLALSEIFKFDSKLKIISAYLTDVKDYHAVIKYEDSYAETTQKLQKGGKYEVPWRPIPETMIILEETTPVENCVVDLFAYLKPNELKQFAQNINLFPPKIKNHHLIKPLIKIGNTKTQDHKTHNLLILDLIKIAYQLLIDNRPYTVPKWFFKMIKYTDQEIKVERPTPPKRPELPELPQKPQIPPTPNVPDVRKPNLDDYPTIAQKELAVKVFTEQMHKRNAIIKEYNTKMEQLKPKIKEYNTLMDQINALVLKSNQEAKHFYEIILVNAKKIQDIVNTWIKKLSDLINKTPYDLHILIKEQSSQLKQNLKELNTDIGKVNKIQLK